MDPRRVVALLRAVNVGGTGKLPMTELKALCEAGGFRDVRTFIASGNVVLTTTATDAKVKATLERALHEHTGKALGVMVRSAADMAAVLADNPFPEGPASRVVAIFLDAPPPADVAETATGVAGERVAPGRREIYVHYDEGLARSKSPGALFGVPSRSPPAIPRRALRRAAPFAAGDARRPGRILGSLTK